MDSSFFEIASTTPVIYYYSEGRENIIRNVLNYINNNFETVYRHISEVGNLLRINSLKLNSSEQKIAVEIKGTCPNKSKFQIKLFLLNPTEKIIFNFSNNQEDYYRLNQHCIFSANYELPDNMAELEELKTDIEYIQFNHFADSYSDPKDLKSEYNDYLNKHKSFNLLNRKSYIEHREILEDVESKIMDSIFLMQSSFDPLNEYFNKCKDIKDLNQYFKIHNLDFRITPEKLYHQKDDIVVFITPIFMNRMVDNQLIGKYDNGAICNKNSIVLNFR